MAAAIWPESKRVIREVRFEGWLDQSPDDFLSDSIPHCRNTQWSELPAALVDVLASQWLGEVLAAFEVFHQLCQVVIEVALEHLDRYLVDARRTAILLDRFESLAHEVLRYASGQ